MAFLLAWWFGGPALACAGTEDPATLASVLDDADNALAELEPERFGAAVDRARAVVACLTAPITPDLAARLHRAVGVRAFGDRDPLAPAAFAAARRIHPEHGFPPTLFPPGSPVDEAWSAFPLRSLRNEVLPSSSDGWTALDGTRSVVRPLDLPVVFQQMRWDGTAVVSAYLLPGEPIPAYTAPPAPGLVLSPHRLTLAVAAAGAGTAAAGLWALSLHGHARYVDLDNPVPDHRLVGLRTRTNALTAGSVLGAGLCAASGALLVATW